MRFPRTRQIVSCVSVFVFASHAHAGISADEIKPERELLITAPAVVDSERAAPGGAWSFDHVFKEIFRQPNTSPEPVGIAADAMAKWLELWSKEQIINGHKVPPRTGVKEKVIEPWQKRDGYDPAAGPWRPKLENAPFRLLAIVNRMDLCAPELAKSFERVRDVWKMRGFEKQFTTLTGRFAPPSAMSQQFGFGGYGGGPALAARSEIRAGQGRLVFGAVDSDGKPLAGGWTVIFEYALQAPDDKGLRLLAQSWHALGSLSPQSSEFGAMLEGVTRGFTDCDKLGPPRLAQIRTSEAVFGTGREFRQFEKNGTVLDATALTATPAPEFAKKHSPESRWLGSFLHEQDLLIRQGITGLPEFYTAGKEPTKVLAGHAQIPQDQQNLSWEPEGKISRDARRMFSMNTCNGCHAGETACESGMHIQPRVAGQAAALSPFLTSDPKGIRINDPAIRGAKVEYRELQDRAEILSALLEEKSRARLEALQDILRGRLQRTH